MAKASDHDPNEQPRLADGTYTYLRRGEGGVDDLLATAARRLDSRFIDRTIGTAERHNALLAGGYVDSVAMTAAADPATRAGIDRDWDQAFAGAEHRADGSGYPLMRDGYDDTGGRSTEGKRRIRREKYDIDGWTFRPKGSKKRCNEEANHVGGPFRMSVTVKDPEGRMVTGEVLVTRGTPGNWDVQPYSTNLGPRGELVAAGVQAMLEAQRPKMIPRHAGGLVGRARERAASSGAGLDTNLRSTWMESVGYDENEGMLVTKTSSGRVYGHTVPRETFEQISTSSSPGAIFNQLVRKNQQGKPVAIAEPCTKCGRVTPRRLAHKCPVAVTAAPDSPNAVNTRSRAQALRIAGRATAARKAIQDRLAPSEAV